ncbi:zinc-finger homeodomain protein 4 [Salvia miltiorrhiza]|uniref:zinc-finger homeodomain protein 4 n=1 Tax=Salvia miltiorrhiza TaxID=226208 RepID=UPI0025ACBC8A|nr:zinc-finger homeodomain protein 4 [Salvia miltiorrhiza]
MEVPSEEGDEMPLPLNSTYGGHGHMIHHHHHHPPPSHNHIIIPSSATQIADDDFKKPVRYRECLKNHAAAMGGNATDGCGEFMPTADLDALTCSACGCHRNFHRKEADGDPCDGCYPRIGRKLFLGHHHHQHKGYRPHQMIMHSYNSGGPSESDEQDGGRAPQLVKKRFRTKFSQEQKEKMLNFAEKVGWKIQKQEEGVVQQFCQEVGVKRRVLKVWMHNNKHTLAKKTLLQSDPQHQSLGTN